MLQSVVSFEQSKMAMASSPLLLLLFVMVLMSLVDATPEGRWSVIVQNAGIASMHAAVTHYDTVILLDRTNVGASRINFTNGFCRDNPDERTLKHDCSAHSVMLDPSSNSVRLLTVLTDTWCSSGQFLTNGSMLQTGGDYEGLYKVRRLDVCAASDSCDWIELSSHRLVDGRWYASNQLLPDGRQIIIGGRNIYTYEYIPKHFSGESSYNLTFLRDVDDNQDDNMYPFVHLLPNGNLFIFANRDSIQLDYKNNAVRKHYPQIPGEPRNYPSAGSSVMLPLLPSNNYTVAEVLVCGGAQYGAYRNSNGSTWGASQTCGRMTMTDDNPNWSMETMPVRRTMGDMILLPTGDVLIINGAQKGSQGWGKATDPAFRPVLYATANATARFRELAATTIPRLYHSTANPLSDGRIVVAGSNTHERYTFTGTFPTELRVESFDPPYLDSWFDSLRPSIYRMSTYTIVHGSTFRVVFKVSKRQGNVEINLESSPFNTHSFSQGQRLVKLSVLSTVYWGGGSYVATTLAPQSAEVVPQAYYMLFIVQASVPGKGVWVRVSEKSNYS